MPGVRGFADPNIHIAEDGTPIWFQYAYLFKILYNRIHVLFSQDL